MENIIETITTGASHIPGGPTDQSQLLSSIITILLTAVIAWLKGRKTGRAEP